jgi:hypothetical protein
MAGMISRITQIGLVLLVVIAASIWYFDVLHQPIETVHLLIGQNYDYAHKIYFCSEPDQSYRINVEDELNEFHKPSQL